MTQCISTDDPNYGCGSCSSCTVFARAATTCSAGQCAMGTCTPGFADCNGNPGDGCEVDLQSPAHCGACNNACAPGEVCTPSGCAAACDPPLTNCQGTCADLLTSPQHCGGCSVVCPGQSFSCVNGSCAPKTCPAGMLLCGSACVHPDLDPRNCGACGVSCPAVGDKPAACVNGSCAPCSPGFTLCAGQCVDPKHDRNNCGGCGTSCTHCVDGLCQPAEPVLVSGLSKVTSLALDADFLYWTDQGANTVSKLPVTGGAPVVVASGQAKPSQIVVDDTTLYWTNNLGGAVMSVPKAGGTPAVFAASTTPYWIAIDTDTVYWWSQGSFTVSAQKKLGGTATVMATFPSANLTSLVVAAAHVYAGSNGPPASFFTIPKGGGPAITSTSAIVDTYTVAVDGNAVYKAQFNMGGFTVLSSFAEGPGPIPIFQPFNRPLPPVTFDSKWIYWSDRAGPSSLYGVYRESKCGGSPVWFANISPQAIVTDDGPYLYWTSATSIGRVTK